jgi:linearmycin/streptolysin S transport system permease protein
VRKVLAIAWNDIRVEFSERVTWIFFLVLPLVFTLIVGQGLQGLNSSPDQGAGNRYVLLVVDADRSSLSKELVAAIANSPVIQPMDEPANEAQKLFTEQQAAALLTIPSGFERALLAGQPVDLLLKKLPNDARTLAIDQGLTEVLSQVDDAVQAARTSVSQAEQIAPFQDAAQRQSFFNASLDKASQLMQEPPARTVLKQSPQATVQIATGFEQSSPGQLVTWTLITLLGASEVFVNERLGGTLRRLLATPTRKATILLGKVIARLGMGLFQMTLLIGFGALALGVDWGRSWGALALVATAFALASVALGTLLGALVRSRSQASGLTTMFSMLLAALGGAWWPLEVTPPAYQAVVKALPTTWAMIGFNDVILRGQGIAAILPVVGVLIAFAAVFFALGIWRLRFQ